MTKVIKILVSPDVYIIIDAIDEHILMSYHWTLVRGNKTHYASAESKDHNGKRKRVMMHRVIMCVSDRHIYVDHKNGNGLDNRRDNLRICTHGENIRNQVRKKRPDTNYKGVYLEKRSRGKDKPFISRICFNKKHIFLGHFSTDKEAAIAYNEAAVKYHGEFASLNIIDH